MKPHFLLSLLIGLFFQSCLFDQTDVDSHGEFDEILVLCRNDLWQNNFKEICEEYFEAPYPVLPQPENTLNVTHVNTEDFKNIFKRYRNILILSDLSDSSMLTQITKSNFNEEQLNKALTDTTYQMGKKNNIWANNQLVVFLFAPNGQQLQSNVINKAELIKNIFLKNELNKYFDAVISVGIHKEIMQKINHRFGWHLNIPQDYFIALDNDEVLWLRKETEEISFNILIHEQDLIGDEFENRAIELRNYVGKKYISSAIKNSYMITDSTLPIESELISFNGISAYQSRGLWRLENDFMGGPFVSYYFENSAKHKSYLIDLFIHAPGSKKKPQIRRLEALVAMMNINKEQL